MNKVIKAKPIRLGSGTLYIQEVTTLPSLASVAEVLAFCKAMAVDGNILGRIKGGASVEYAKTVLTVEDDLGVVSKTVITTETVNFTSGVMTWDGETLTKLCETCRVDDDPISGKRLVKIGGIDNADGKKYILLFVHKDAQDGDIYVLLTGKNTAGFKLDFKKDAETVIDATFAAEALDTTGTKLVYLEDIPASGIMEITSEAGTTEGTTKLTVKDVTLASGESYAYSKGSDLPAYLGAATGFTAWDGSAEIEAETGSSLLVVVQNAENKIVKAGIVTVTAKAAAED